MESSRDLHKLLEGLIQKLKSTVEYPVRQSLPKHDYVCAK